MLPAKFETSKRFAPQRCPELTFRIRHAAAQMLWQAAGLYCFVGLAQHHRPHPNPNLSLKKRVLCDKAYHGIAAPHDVAESAIGGLSTCAQASSAGARSLGCFCSTSAPA